MQPQDHAVNKWILHMALNVTVNSHTKNNQGYFFGENLSPLSSTEIC